ncbi:MAG: hypothetical protein HFE64_03175 [Lachnospiraceae bacterium]|jgi:hypothetical protein|nr:hypothetical protein [Lachnospiraceae bacterium]
MTEKEKLIEDRIRKAIPQLTTDQQEAWLTIGETMVLIKNIMEENRRKEAEPAS